MTTWALCEVTRDSSTPPKPIFTSVYENTDLGKVCADMAVRAKANAGKLYAIVDKALLGGGGGDGGGILGRTRTPAARISAAAPPIPTTPPAPAVPPIPTTPTAPAAPPAND